MALTLISSNRVETLQSSLSRQLGEFPLRDPFATEIVVVPTYAMGRWLNLRIAQQQGVAANIRYPHPAQWIWQLASHFADRPQAEDPFAPEVLAWRIFDRLPALLEGDAFALLRSYLDDDGNGVRRWQLAQRIATSFDRYQLYRPQQMRAWSDGENPHWQAELWRDLVDSAAGPPRTTIIADAIRLLDTADEVPGLPERISLFALSSLAPTLVEFVHALAGQIEIIFYHHSPTDQYWADLQSEKARARQRLRQADGEVYQDGGNSLLASWGRQGQALQDLLLDLGPVTRNEIDLNQPPAADSMLHSLQRSLFMLEQAPPEGPVDDSIAVHLCHSPMRECQVLHDWLLNLLERNPDLACEDILVMVPEIDRYAPYIEAVFQADASGQRPDLPWNISDIGVGVGHPLIPIFLQMLQLPASRFTRSEIMAYLECAEIRERFGIDEAMREAIHELLETARVRWGIDAAQRGELGLPATHENSWQQAWERIFSGYAIDAEGLWLEIAPIGEIDRDAALAMARFRYLFERLVFWRQRLARDLPARAWQQRLLELIDEFFAPRVVAEDNLQPLRDAIGRLGDAETGKLAPALVRHWMERQLATSQQAGRLYSGGITFCGMQPMRNIPFPVICVLGMHDSAFPRRDPAIEFDLMHTDWRPGDPRHADEDRYLMLETLLCARRYLYFSYCGRSLKDNSECQPSPLLRELLDYIDLGFVRDGDDSPASTAISRTYPMQAFSPRNFMPAAGRAFDRCWFDTALLLQERGGLRRERRWPDAALEPVTETSPVVELDRLLRFFSHPVRYFFQQRLGIRIPDERVIDDDECFALDSLQKWALAMRLAERHIRGETVGIRQFSAEGLLPHGAAAHGEWRALQREYRGLLVALEDFRDRPDSARTIECRFEDGSELVGEVRACYAGAGLVHFSASRRAKARATLGLWLNHLALCAGGQLDAGETSRLLLPVGTGAEFHAIDGAQARALLRDYLDLFAQGQSRPLPLFAETSYAWALQQDPVVALQKAHAAWHGAGYARAAPGEGSDAFIGLALHHGVGEPFHDPRFQQLARTVFAPVIAQAVSDD